MQQVVKQPVSLQEALFFLWKLKNRLNDIQYELETMMNKRRPIRLLGRFGYLPPLVDPVDEQANEEDEIFADQLFIDLSEFVNEFLDNYSGIEINM